MSERVAVSVLMTVYNEEVHVRESIDSILNQTFTDLELIIIDDGSTDGTPLLLKEAAEQDPRVKLVFAGRVASRPKLLNQAVEMSRGEFVAIQDADDVSLPTRIQRQTEFLRAHPDVGVIGTACIVVDRETGAQLRIRQAAETDAEIRRKLFRHIPYAHSTMMMRRDLVLALGGYDLQYAFPHDYDLVFRIAEVAEIAGISEPLLLSRARGYFGRRVRRWSRTQEVIHCQWANWRRQGHLVDLPYVSIFPVSRAIYGSLRRRFI